MPVKIRRAAFSDLPALSRLSRQGAEEDYQLHPPKVRQIIAERHSARPMLLAMLRGGRAIIVAETEDALIGLLVGTPNSDGVGVVQWLYVAPEGRGGGVAGKLLESFEKAAKAAGSHKLMAWTEVAAAYYKKIGWVEEVKLPNHWWGKDFSIMGKDL